MPHGLTHARAVPPYSVCPIVDATQIDEAALLQAWDRDIRRAARAGARRLKSAVVDGQRLRVRVELPDFQAESDNLVRLARDLASRARPGAMA